LTINTSEKGKTACEVKSHTTLTT